MDILRTGLTKEEALDTETALIRFLKLIDFMFDLDWNTNIAVGGSFPSPNRGKKLSPEHKAKLNAGRRGMKLTEKQKEHLRLKMAHRSTRLLSIHVETGEVQIFPSIHSTALAGHKRDKIYQALDTQRTYHNRKWRRAI